MQQSFRGLEDAGYVCRVQIDETRVATGVARVRKSRVVARTGYDEMSLGMGRSRLSARVEGRDSVEKHSNHHVGQTGEEPTGLAAGAHGRTELGY